MPKLLFIHEEKKFQYGAHYINGLIITKLRNAGYSVDTIYPKESINFFSKSLTGLNNILFFYSLINKKRHSSEYDIVQGTTYTVLPFLENGVKVVSHFGSTTFGFLKSVPSNKKLHDEEKKLEKIFSELKKALRIKDSGVSIKSIEDINKIEIGVASKSNAVIATSQGVKKELVSCGINPKKIFLVHNAIEDYWFKRRLTKKVNKKASIVYVGRMGDDAFTIKLKGINRLYYVLNSFPNHTKKIIGMCYNVNSYLNFFSQIPNVKLSLSLEKKRIPNELKENFGDIFVNPGRYEGFCLSLVEAMSQGLIPITFPIGVAPEIITNGKNGFLVKDLDEMIQKINLIKDNPALRKKMALESVKTSKQFTSDIMVKKFESIYSKLAGKKKKIRLKSKKISGKK
jgi:glycosyltransferase involved in cell wall biosynthesis